MKVASPRHGDSFDLSSSGVTWSVTGPITCYWSLVNTSLSSSVTTLSPGDNMVIKEAHNLRLIPLPRMCLSNERKLKINIKL